MSKNREKKHAAEVAERAAHAKEAVESAAEHHEQHLVEAPKGTSRARFIFNLGLVIFLLLIFSITGPMMSSLDGGGGGSDEVSLGWTTPDGERRELGYTEYITEKRRFGTLERFLQLLMLGQADPGDDIHLARFLILEQLAQRFGIHVSDKEVSDSIVTWFGTAESYRAYIAGTRGLSAKAFEANMRRGLAVRRYIKLAVASAGEVLTEDVIARWLEGAKEYNFQYVELAADELEPEARAELPDDQALEDFFGAMPASEQKLFSTERSLSAKVAWLDPKAEGDHSLLLERYPAPEGTDLEEQAQTYYQGFSHIRFVQPEAPEPEDDEAQDIVKLSAGAKFFSFEEVADQVRREAPVYNAMVAWLADIQQRLEAGDVLDLETEAISLGMDFKLVEPRSRSAWVDGVEPWAGPYFFSTLSGAVEGKFGPRVAVEEGALVLTQLLEIRPPVLPPFVDIRDQVADKWVEKRQLELSVERLDAVRDAFGERPEEGLFETSASSEEFAAAVEAAGLNVVERGWERQFPKTSGKPSAADLFIRSKSILLTLPADDVPRAEASRDGKTAYLLRCLGEREGDPANMTPSEAANARNGLQVTAQNEWYRSRVIEDAWLRETFNLVLASE